MEVAEQAQTAGARPEAGEPPTLDAIEQRFDAELRRGNHEGIVAELEAVADRYPLREPVQALLMLALQRSGRLVEAAMVFHRAQKLLVECFGMEPGAELQARFQAVLAEEPAAASGPGIAPPLRPQIATARGDNLPEAPTSFLGRAEAISELVHLLQWDRLVTLVGPRGIGKTRLALEVAKSAARDFEDGAWLVDLAPVADADMVDRAALAALGLHELPEMSPLESLTSLLEARELLLVVDNCDHQLEAVAQTLPPLLASCPGVHVLAAGRERLGVEDERVWHVPPFRVPARIRSASLDDIVACDALHLFAACAARARPGFELNAENATAVAEICQRLDGIPLALELAAAQARRLDAGALRDEIDERMRALTHSKHTSLAAPPTVRATLEWSASLLSPRDRLLLHRLCVFSGSFSLSAVEGICAEQRTTSEATFAAMGHLVAASLVVATASDTGTRYSLLGTVRDFAEEQLSDADVAALRGRHARFYTEFGRECERLYLDAQQGAARRRYAEEYGNARAALRWAIEADPEAAMELAGTWRFYWWLDGLLSEGRLWLQRTLDQSTTNPVTRAQVLSGLGRLVAIQGEEAAAIECFSEGLRLAQDAGDEFMTAELTHSLGVVKVGGATNDEADACFRRAAELWQRLGYRQGLSSAYGNLGECAFYAERYDDARERYLQQVDMGQEYSRYYGLVNLSHLEYILGNNESAWERAAEALPLATPLYAAVAVEAFAFIAAARGQTLRAATLGIAAARLYAAHGARPDPMPRRDDAEASLRQCVSVLDDIGLTHALELGWQMPLSEVISYAVSAD